MTNRIEVRTRDHFSAKLIVNEEREHNSFIVKSVVKSAHPLRQCTAVQYHVQACQWNTICTIDLVAVSIPSIGIACELTYLFTHHLPQLAIKHVCGRGDPFPWC